MCGRKANPQRKPIRVDGALFENVLARSFCGEEKNGIGADFFDFDHGFFDGTKYNEG